MIVFGAQEIAFLLHTSESNAYNPIRKLKAELNEMGKLTPAQGRIQARFFCERFGLDIEECQEVLKTMPTNEGRKKKEAS